MIGYQLAIQAVQRPTQIALSYGAQQLTYLQLYENACRVANALYADGVRPGDRVAVLLHNCNAFVEILFACALSGVVFVPINFRLVGREVGMVLDACNPRLLVAGETFSQMLSQITSNSLGRTTRWINDGPPQSPSGWEDAYARWRDAHSAPLPQTTIPSDTLLILLHSSGTTGLPKGIMHSHATTLASCSAKIIDLELKPTDAPVVFGPLFHAGPLMDLTLPLLLRGGRVVLGASRQFDPQQLLQAIAAHRVTVVPIYPTMLRRLLETPEDAGLDLSSLRLIITGGESAPIPVIQGVHQRFPTVAFYNNYGSTDGGPVTTFLAPELSRNRMGSVGKESFSVQVRIVDETGQTVAPEVVGELIVRSPFVCLGYWMRPQESAAQLRDGWWYTGDLAYRDADGCIWIARRSKDIVKSGTENIYPIEVEQVIATLPGVTEVAVIGVPDAHWGESVAAYVVRQPDAVLTAQAIVAHCREHLASYKKPRHVVFVDSLPRGTTNKVNKNRLRQLWSEAAQPPA